MLVNSLFWQEFDYTFFLKSLLLCIKKIPQSNIDILTLTETESRLSLGMTSNKTYHFQTTANHHRFIKVWTSIADLPTSKFVVQTFFLEKVWLRNTLPTYDLDICPNFRSFFFGSLSLAGIRKVVFEVSNNDDESDIKPQTITKQLFS